jgi:hypothetical protein
MSPKAKISDHTHRWFGYLRAVSISVMPLFLLVALSGCERFRHEKYACPPNSLGLVEFIINDDRAGAEISIVEVDREYTMTIGSISASEMITANDQMIMMLNRDTGKVKVTISSVAMTMLCEKSVFTM